MWHADHFFKLDHWIIQPYPVRTGTDILQLSTERIGFQMDLYTVGNLARDGVELHHLFCRAGFEKVYLLQNDTNLSASEVISTYVYKVGLIKSDFSFSTAVEMFNSVINCILLLLVNFIAGRLGETSLW